MIRRLAVLATAGLGAAAILERWLEGRRRAGGGPDTAIRSVIEIEASIERVWELVTDVERQPSWMAEMKSVRMVTPAPLGVGSRGVAEVRILGIAVADPVEVVVFEPPRRYGIRHEGRYSGSGLITLTPRPDGISTIVEWAETLVPPFFPNLGSIIQKPLLGAIFQADLARLKELVEEEATVLVAAPS